MRLIRRELAVSNAFDRAEIRKAFSADASARLRGVDVVRVSEAAAVRVSVGVDPGLRCSGGCEGY